MAHWEVALDALDLDVFSRSQVSRRKLTPSSSHPRLAFVNLQRSHVVKVMQAWQLCCRVQMSAIDCQLDTLYSARWTEGMYAAAMRQSMALVSLYQSTYTQELHCNMTLHAHNKIYELTISAMWATSVNWFWMFMLHQSGLYFNKHFCAAHPSWIFLKVVSMSVVIQPRITI